MSLTKEKGIFYKSFRKNFGGHLIYRKLFGPVTFQLTKKSTTHVLFYQLLKDNGKCIKIYRKKSD